MKTFKDTRTGWSVNTQQHNAYMVPHKHTLSCTTYSVSQKTEHLVHIFCSNFQMGPTILIQYQQIQGGHSLGRKKFKDFSRTLNSLFRTYSVDVNPATQ